MIIRKLVNDPVYSTLISDTASNTGVWNMITIIEDTTFTTLTDANRDGNTLTTSESFSAGITIYGNFTVIKLASGVVIAYKA